MSSSNSNNDREALDAEKRRLKNAKRGITLLLLIIIIIII
jgi:hypothetical protein